MPKTNTDPTKARPGDVAIRLFVPTEIRDRFRGLAAMSPDRNMAERARRLVIEDVERWEREKTGNR